MGQEERDCVGVTGQAKSDQPNQEKPLNLNQQSNRRVSRCQLTWFQTSARPHVMTCVTRLVLITHM